MLCTKNSTTPEAHHDDQGSALLPVQSPWLGRIRRPAAGILGGVVLGLFLFASTVSAQNARIPESLHPAVNSVGLRLAVHSDGDLTAAVWVDEILLQVFCSVSDGRGVQWSAPLRVDSGSHAGSNFPLTLMDATAVFVSGENIYVTWRELGLPTGDGQVLFARSTNSGFSFGSEVVIDDSINGFAKSPRAVMGVSPDPAGDHIYILRLDSDSFFAPLVPRVAASHNGGQSFGPAIPVSLLPSSGIPAREISVVAEGMDVHVVWVDDLLGLGLDEVYYQFSANGGLTWLDDDVLISRGFDNVSSESEARFVARGDHLIATYIATSNVTATDELRYSRSTDGGDTWQRGLSVVTAPTGVSIVGQRPHLTATDRLVLAWEDGSSGALAVYSSSLPPFGSVFSAPATLWSTSGLGGSEVQITSPRDASEPDTVWITFDGGTKLNSGSNGYVPSFLSRDGGQSFEPGVELDTLRDADGDHVSSTYNAIYDNYISLWNATGPGIEAVRSGGIRSQTVVPMGVVSGGTAQFDFSGFAAPTGGAKFVWVLASDDPGNLPLPLMDGRDLGLTPDATFFATLSSPTLFSGMLDANGEGSTPSFGMSLPAGTVFYVAGVAIALGPVDLVEVTDVQAVLVL